jgi:mxaJ protein
MKLSAVVSLFILVGVWFVLAPVPLQALGVCADPDYLPYSDRSGAGFENKIAEAVAKLLNEPVQYTWASNRGHGGFLQFLASTLDAKTCDIVMSIPYGSREELTTRPYYISSYVFVYDKSKKYDITSMDSQVLKRVKIGFERETPGEDALKVRGLDQTAVPFDIADDPGQSPASMLAALNSGKIDVLITWQPAISSFLRSAPNLEVVPVPNERALGVPEQYAFPMSMGVRAGNEELKKRLDEVIEGHQGELTKILSDNGVLSFTPSQGDPRR